MSDLVDDRRRSARGRPKDGRPTGGGAERKDDAQSFPRSAFGWDGISRTLKGNLFSDSLLSLTPLDGYRRPYGQLPRYCIAARELRSLDYPGCSLDVTKSPRPCGILHSVREPLGPIWELQFHEKAGAALRQSCKLTIDTVSGLPGERRQDHSLRGRVDPSPSGADPVGFDSTSTHSMPGVSRRPLASRRCLSQRLGDRLCRSLRSSARSAAQGRVVRSRPAHAAQRKIEDVSTAVTSAFFAAVGHDRG